MNLYDQICSDELLKKWFIIMYQFETGVSCSSIRIMISDLRNRGLSDDDIISIAKLSYPRRKLCI